MPEIESNSGMQNLLNDLNLHPDTQVETEVYNGIEQQELTIYETVMERSQNDG